MAVGSRCCGEELICQTLACVLLSTSGVGKSVAVDDLTRMEVSSLVDLCKKVWLSEGVSLPVARPVTLAVARARACVPAGTIVVARHNRTGSFE